MFAFRLGLALRWSLHSFAGHNGGGIPRNMTDEPPVLRVHNQGFMQTLRQLRFGKLLKGTGKGGFVRHLACTRPATQAAQVPVCTQMLQQLTCRAQAVHRFSNKGRR